VATIDAHLDHADLLSFRAEGIVEGVDDSRSSRRAASRPTTTAIS